MSGGIDDLEEVHPLRRAEWRSWLQEHHATALGVWFVQYKKRTGKPRLEYEEAVEEALCFGWIDSRMQPLDEDRARLLFSPRKPGGTWSRSNKERVERLERDGLMTTAGSRVIERSKADRSWNLLDDVEALRVPPDLAAALAADDEALAHFEAFTPSARKGVLWWIVSAKRAETRARRVAETVRLAARGLTPLDRSP